MMLKTAKSNKHTQQKIVKAVRHNKEILFLR